MLSAWINDIAIRVYNLLQIFRAPVTNWTWNLSILFSLRRSVAATAVNDNNERTFMTFLTEKKLHEISRRQFVSSDKYIFNDCAHMKGLRNHNNMPTKSRSMSFLIRLRRTRDTLQSKCFFNEKKIFIEWREILSIESSCVSFATLEIINFLEEWFACLKSYFHLISNTARAIVGQPFAIVVVAIFIALLQVFLTFNSISIMAECMRWSRHIIRKTFRPLQSVNKVA